MSFWRKVFSKWGDAASNQQDERSDTIEYRGYVICATPYKTDGQLQSCGLISKHINGKNAQYKFIRADRFTNMDDAVYMIHIKARQIIDEQGDNIFNAA